MTVKKCVGTSQFFLDIMHPENVYIFLGVQSILVWEFLHLKHTSFPLSAVRQYSNLFSESFLCLLSSLHINEPLYFLVRKYNAALFYFSPCKRMAILIRSALYSLPRLGHFRCNVAACEGMCGYALPSPEYEPIYYSY